MDDMNKTESALVSLDRVRAQRKATLSWDQLGLQLTRGKDPEPYSNAFNVARILAADYRFATTIWYDADSKLIMIDDRSWTDSDDNDVLLHIQSEYQIPRMSMEPIRQGVDQYARTRSRAPLTDWLRSLKWDGTQRVATWHPGLCSKEPRAYASHHRSKFWAVNGIGPSLSHSALKSGWRRSLVLYGSPKLQTYPASAAETLITSKQR